MAKISPTMEAEIKTRVPEAWKDDLERIATQEQSGLSFIVRRALSEYIARRKRAKRAA